MTHPERWELISSTFLEAVELPSSERAAFLERACAGDRLVHAEVVAMLAVAESPPLAIEQRLSAESSAFQTLPPGTRIGPYRIASLIGQGGMGEVYRAERVDGEYSQSVAVKLLRPGYLTAETVRRFRTERQVLARLVHPGIAAILDGGTAPDGRPYLVLQFVDGVSITAHCRERKLTVDDRLRLFLQVVEAVQFAHSHLVVHRDLKPSNILVQSNGSPRLLDFGIAKLLDNNGDGSEASTRPDVRLLTPEHAAPEQLRGEPVTIATDVYGLGVLLFELLTDCRPFTGTGRTPRELERLIIEEDAPLPSAVAATPEYVRRLRGDLDRIVLKTLRKEPSRRYSSAVHLGEDLQRFLSGHPVEAQRDTLRYRVQKFVARNRSLVTGSVAALLLLSTFAVTMAVQARELARERDVAERERAAAESAVATLSDLVQRANPRLAPGGDTLRLGSLLADAERWIDGLDGQGSRQAGLSRVLGNMHAGRGDFARAKTLLTRARDLMRAAPIPDSVALAAIEHELAVVVFEHEGAVAAEPLLRQSVSALSSTLGGRHADVATAVEDLALATASAERRRALLDSAVALRENNAAIDPIVQAGQLNASASEYMARGRAREALNQFDAALAILARQLPPEHPHRMAVARNIVTTLMRLGEWERAEVLQRQVMLLNPDTAETVAGAYDRNSAALLAAHRGRLAEAEVGLREALSILRRLLAPDHERIDNTMRNLGLVVAARGRVAEGLALLDTAVTRARGPGRESQQSAGYMTGQRVSLLLRLGRLYEADSAATESWRVLEATTTSDDIARADANLWRGMVAFVRERKDAADFFESAVTRLEREYDANHPALGRARCALGAALVRERRSTTSASPSACEAHARWGLADPLIVEWGRTAFVTRR